MNKGIYFGIDGGGTHSRIAIVNEEGEMLVRVKAGSTNIYSVSREEVFQNLSFLLSEGLKQCSAGRNSIAGGCIGSAGLGRPEEAKIFRDFFDRLLGPDIPVICCTDGEILLCGVHGGLEGYCLIAGTGSLALGRAADGRLVRSGGFGYLLGDEGGAAWIGRSAIARALRSQEGRDLPTGLMPDILSYCRLASTSDLIRYIHHDAGKPDIAALAPLVSAAAGGGDPLALDVLKTGAAELAGMVRSVVDRSPWIKNRSLVLAGGVLEHDALVVDELKKLLAEICPQVPITTPEGGALEGACILARETLPGLPEN
jgi:N-acetylglucosamine kinase-like BadF-type ATPase